MTAKRYDRRGVTALGGFLFFLCLGMSPALGSEVEDRIRALEAQQRANAEELARLKGEQMELRKEARTAADKLPSFSYRPRAGLRIQAADRSWALETRARLHYRVMFFDDVAEESEGFNQGRLALRRWRIRLRPSWANGFYRLNLEFDGSDEREIQIQKGELEVRFSRINPYFPDFVMGRRVSGFFNRHDTNWGSSTGGFFDRSMFQDGAGIGAGSNNNAAALDWGGVPLGPGRIRVLQIMYSNSGLAGGSLGASDDPGTDNRAAHIGFNIEPFSNTKSKWIEGIDLGFTWHMDQIDPEIGGAIDTGNFRVRTTERQRLELIQLGTEPEGQRHYFTPGFGWKIGPYWLRTALAWNRADLVGGGEVRGWMWRIGNELFIWSPKGFLTGSTSTAGSLMFFGGFERNNYRASNDGLEECSAGGANCQSAYAYNTNAGLWYFIRPGFRVGVEYSFYHVNKINADGAGDLKGVAAGEDTDYNSVDLGFTFDW